MFATGCLVIGLLLIGIGLTDTWRRELPFSASALYLLAGWLIGPQQFALIGLELESDAELIEMLCEVAVLISLFAVGLRLRVSLRDRLWMTPLVLASATMVITIAALAGAGLWLGLPLGAALLLGAVLAPTDPVLASDVQVENPGDRDRLRFAISGEGGLNDGAAFPFVMLALGLLGAHDLGALAWRWWSIDLIWAVAGGLAIGWGLGYGFGRVVLHLRREREQAFGMESFLTLGLIALTYGITLAASAYGFLAVFMAGLALRKVERTDTSAHSGPRESAYMARAVLDFAIDLERFAELAVMLLIGSLLQARHFSGESLAIAALLIFVVRPLAVAVTTTFLKLGASQRALIAWFGVRGIGSVYYLAFAVAHGAQGEAMGRVVDAVLATVVLSVLLHGASAPPVMRLYARARGRGPG